MTILSACGGGSSGSKEVSVSSPAVFAEPERVALEFGPSYVTEYERQSGLAQVQAASAYDEGYAGFHVKLAVVDTGFESMRAQVPSQIPIALIGPARPADEIRDMLQRGVAGYLPYSLATASMLAALRVLAAGETYVPVEMLSAPEPAKNRIGGYLTGRERDVLNGLLAGQSNKEIAREHGLSEVTIKHHLKSLRSKLGARNRTHAVCRAVELGIAEDEYAMV